MFLKRLWPSSLRGQVLLSIALALLLAQTVSAVLIYRAQHERTQMALTRTLAFRLVPASRSDSPPDRDAQNMRRGNASNESSNPRQFRLQRLAANPIAISEQRMTEEESDLRTVLAEQDVQVSDLQLAIRPISGDALAMRQLTRPGRMHFPGPQPRRVIVAALKTASSPEWLVTRTFMPEGEQRLLGSLLAQTLFIYAFLVGAMALILGRITRPLATLTGRVERFAETRDAQGQITPEGPSDVRRLIAAHNALEGRIVALLDEKDVMLGAIGHDLKTPLAALRVRIESVEDATERGRMATTIEDITRSLDDILSLARVGRPSDASEPTELSSLVASVAEEYEDMGEPVKLVASERMVMQVRPTWLRRALRNLIGNGLRYGGNVQVSLSRAGDYAMIRMTDEGPGIADSQIARMMEPFTRGEPSRNTETGGAGLGLTLAKAIAEQHGGTLTLANLRGADGATSGLEAVLRLPLADPSGSASRF